MTDATDCITVLKASAQMEYSNRRNWLKLWLDEWYGMTSTTKVSWLGYHRFLPWPSRNKKYHVHKPMGTYGWEWSLEISGYFKCTANGYPLPHGINEEMEQWRVDMMIRRGVGWFVIIIFRNEKQKRFHHRKTNTIAESTYKEIHSVIQTFQKLSHLMWIMIISNYCIIQNNPFREQLNTKHKCSDRSENECIRCCISIDPISTESNGQTINRKLLWHSIDRQCSHSMRPNTPNVLEILLFGCIAVPGYKRDGQKVKPMKCS